MGPPELLIIALVILLLFGGAKLPALFRSLGRAKSEFEAGAREGTPPPAPGPASAPAPAPAPPVQAEEKP
jgi:sec-independent protein translocase protein TatA